MTGFSRRIVVVVIDVASIICIEIEVILIMLGYLWVRNCVKFCVYLFYKFTVFCTKKTIIPTIKIMFHF